MRNSDWRDSLRPPALSCELHVFELQRNHLLAVHPSRSARVDDAVEGANAIDMKIVGIIFAWC